MSEQQEDRVTGRDNSSGAGWVRLTIECLLYSLQYGVIAEEALPLRTRHAG